jgi:3-oxoacyl-[acyl-carrier protein] reductase
MGKLDGKVAIITGAGSGIGEAGARLFAREGAAVVVADVVAERVGAVVDAIAAAGGEALGSTTDVSRLDDVEAMVDAAIAAYGRIDVLWNNAGIVREIWTPIEEIPVDTWHEVLGVNLHGVFYCLRCVIPHMKAQRRGAIVNTASIAGLVAHIPGRAPYTASKGALVSLTRLLALELAGFNIRVNCIAPGRVRTDIRGSNPERPAENRFGLEWSQPEPAPVTDATRVAEPEEIAQTALYLVSDDVGPLTGVTIAHDGGRTTR